MNYASEIKARVSTRDFCQSVGIQPDRHGDALCPFHGDTNKSLRVYNNPEKGWVCFGCHRGGSVIDFAMLWYGIDFKQAIVRLDSDFALGLPIGAKRTPEDRRRARREAAERARRKEEAERALYAAESSFLTASRCYAETLSIVERNRPKRPENGISNVYADALWMLPLAREEWHKAQHALDLAREEVRNIGTSTTA